jgi:hypothetical protein
MQHEPNFTDHLTDHLANRQRPSGIPEDLLDEVDAAALEGARSVDSVAHAGRQAGAHVEGSVVPSLVFNRLGERHGYPLTELQECIHLAVSPIQPRYIYAAALTRAFCRECLTEYLLDEDDDIRSHDVSTTCDACGADTKAEDLRIGNLSKGMVTYAVVQICPDCMTTGP